MTMYSAINDMYKRVLFVYTAKVDSFNDKEFTPKCNIKCAVYPASEITQDSDGNIIICKTKIYYKDDMLETDDYILLDDKYHLVRKLEKTVDTVADKVLGGVAYI